MTGQTRVFLPGVITTLVGVSAVRALLRGAVLFGLTMAETALLLVPVSSVVASTRWPQILLHGIMTGPYIWGWLIPGLVANCVLGRRVLTVHRRLVTRWCGVEVDDPYRPRPALERTEHGW